MTTIPETVARVLDLDAQGTPNPELTAYYRTAAPALAREVERLEKMLDVCGDVHAHNVKLVADRNTARAECERLRAGLVERRRHSRSLRSPRRTRPRLRRRA